MEVTSSGIYRTYVMNGGSVIAEQSYDNNFYWVHTDHLGSGRKLTNTSGTMIYRAEFDPYGKLLYEWSSPANLNTRKFTGYERDGATGLDYAQARMYGSEWGRFLSPDPKGLGSASLTSPKSLNRYAYVQNDPVNKVDPAGTDYLGWTGLFFAQSDCQYVGGSLRPGFLSTGDFGYICWLEPWKSTKQLLEALGENQPRERTKPKVKPILLVNAVPSQSEDRGCGNANSSVQFSLFGDLTGVDGWIIQHITESGSVASLGTPVGRKAPIGSVYEAWRVQNGVIFIGNTYNIHKSDNWSLPYEGVGTEGYRKITASIQFFLNGEINYDPASWDDPQITGYNYGDLKATRGPLSGWNDRAGKIHELEVFWDCYGSNVQTVNKKP